MRNGARRHRVCYSGADALAAQSRRRGMMAGMDVLSLFRFRLRTLMVLLVAASAALYWVKCQLDWIDERRARAEVQDASATEFDWIVKESGRSNRYYKAAKTPRFVRFMGAENFQLLVYYGPP